MCLELKSQTNNLQKLVVKKYESNYRIECIQLLNRVASLGFWTSKRFQQEIEFTVLNPSQDIFLATKNEIVVGMMVLHTKLNEERTIPEIGYVAVDPKERGQHLGLKLLQFVIKTAVMQGYTKVFLKTDGFRVPAIKLYMKVGFTALVQSADDQRRWGLVYKKINAK